MKFDCGISRKERKQLLREKREVERQARLQRRYLGEVVFAWFPKRVGPHDCRWLEYVDRRDANVKYDPPFYGRDGYYYNWGLNPRWEYTAIE